MLFPVEYRINLLFIHFFNCFFFYFFTFKTIQFYSKKMIHSTWEESTLIVLF